MRRSEKVVTLILGVVIAILVIWFNFPRHRLAPPALPAVSARGVIIAQRFHLGVVEAHELTDYESVLVFGDSVGRQPDIVLNYTTWPRTFQIKLASIEHTHQAMPFTLLNPGKLKMLKIAMGVYNSYFKHYADQVRSFRWPVMIGFAPEMNGTWYPWAWHHTPPAVWVSAWRHVVNIFRQEHARNVIWVWTVNRGSLYTGNLSVWWPGAQYVDWIGIDGYYFLGSDTFAKAFDPTIRSIRRITGKPILLSEVGIGQVAGQVKKIPGLFAGIKANHLIGMVWFDVFQNSGEYHQDWRLEGHGAAIAAFRTGLRLVGAS